MPSVGSLAASALAEVDTMGLSRSLFFASSALVLGAVAAAQPRQEVKPPQAQAWIDVATFSGMGMPMMGGPGGGGPMSALGGLFGGGGPSKVSFLMTQTGSSGSYVDVTLMSRRNPQLAEAAQAVPPGLLSPALKLVAPREAPPLPPGDNEEVVPETQKPQGRISLYWGCGDTVRAGQPRVIDLATASPADLAQVFQARRATQRGAHAAGGRPHWPNPTDARALREGASLVGNHEFSGNGVPAGFRFAIPAAQDLMPPMQLQQAAQDGGAIALSWAAQPNARAFFAVGISARGQNEMVIWTSSEVPDLGMGLIDYQTNAAVDRWLREKVLLAPATTRCTVPKGVLAEGAMLRAIAYGHELNLAHPPRPSDPKVAWEPEWAVKVRVKSVGMAIAGMPAMEGAPQGEMQQAKEPAARSEEPKKPGVLDVLRGVIGR
jgi:hypothetical protein